MQSVRMDEASTMTVPPPLAAKSQNRDGEQVARQTVSIRTVSPPSSPQLTTTGAGATVFVGVASPAVGSTAISKRRIPEVQSANGYGRQSNVQPRLQHQQQQQQQQRQQAAHVVKIKINPDGDKKNSKVISTVTLTLDDQEEYNKKNNIPCERSVVVSATNLVNEKLHGSGGRVGEGGCVRISVGGDATKTRERLEEKFSDKGTEKTGDLVDSCISNNNNNNSIDSDKNKKRETEMVQRVTSETLNSAALSNRSSGCFYYSTYQNPLNGMVMSSGQCSPSETLDSGTCSDLDGTPPPLPKKKNAKNVGSGGATTVILSIGQHDRTGSLTSSGAELDSDDNESNISCDSLNGGEFNNIDSRNDVNGKTSRQDGELAETSKDSGTEDIEGVAMKLERVRTSVAVAASEEDKGARKDGHLREGEETEADEEEESLTRSSRASPSISRSPSGTSSLSKASSTPRIRSPEPNLERSARSSGTSSPVVKECTYEERKQQQERLEQQTAAADFYANYNRSNGHKYLYDDDRFYKFHVNELRHDGEESNGDSTKEPAAHGLGPNETDECFAGYKILEREAIRSAKGTVRGVKNRVRAGIATFLQKPSSKAYKAKEEGKVVVYTTSSGIVRLTFYNCMKVKQILNTHMVKYEERDLFRSAELQTELRDRIGCTAIQVPQLFVDGQYIGDADTVERLNESGELRRMLKPYQSDGACPSCLFCGNYRLLVCPVCNGSKRSVLRNDFTVEFVALKCMNCDETGLVPCQHC